MRSGKIFLPLFEQPLARTKDPQASHAAAAQLIKSGRRRSHKQRVLAAPQRHPHSTSAELAFYCGMDRVEVARRLPDLAQDGQVMQGNERFCTVSQKNCVTWAPVKNSLGGA